MIAAMAPIGGCFEGVCFKHVDRADRSATNPRMMMGMPPLGRPTAAAPRVAPARPAATPAPTQPAATPAPRRPGGAVEASNARTSACSQKYGQMTEPQRGLINARFQGRDRTPATEAEWCDAVERVWSGQAVSHVAPAGAASAPRPADRATQLRETVSAFRRLPQSAQANLLINGSLNIVPAVRDLGVAIQGGDWGEQGASETFVAWLDRSYALRAPYTTFRQEVLRAAVRLGVPIDVPFITPAGRVAVRPGGELVPNFTATEAQCRALPGGSWNADIGLCYVEDSATPGTTQGPSERYATETECMDAGGTVLGDGATATCSIGGRQVPIGTAAPGVDHTAEYVGLIATGVQSAVTIVTEVLRTQNAAEARQFAQQLQAQQQQFAREAAAGNQQSAIQLRNLDIALEQMRRQTADANARAAANGRPPPFPPELLALLANKPAPTPTWVYVAGGVTTLAVLGGIAVIALRPQQPVLAQLPARQNPGHMGDHGFEYVEVSMAMSKEGWARLGKLLRERLTETYPIEAHGTSQDAKVLKAMGVKPTGTGEHGRKRYELTPAKARSLIVRMLKSGDEQQYDLASSMLSTLDIGTI